MPRPRRHRLVHFMRHPNRWVRRAVGVGLILGGLLGFLPILGFWMVPLGLLVLSDEVPALRRLRRRLLVRFGRRYPRARAFLRRWLPIAHPTAQDHSPSRSE